MCVGLLVQSKIVNQGTDTRVAEARVVNLGRVLMRAVLRITRTILALVGKHTAVSLLLAALAIAYVAGFILGLESLDTALYPFILFLIVTGGAILTWAAVVPALLRAHRWLQQRFRESVQARQSSRRTRARVLVGSILNLAYFIILYFASYQAVLKSIFPLAGIMEGIMPIGYWAVMAQTWPIFLILFFAGSLGPATLYAITWFRRENGIQEPKETVLTLLQLVCYLSCLFLILCIFTQAATQLVYFERTYLMSVLPGTFASLAILLWIERLGRL